MINIYNAGPLFNEADRSQRNYEEFCMKDLLGRYKITDYSIYNPATTEINFEVGNPTPAEIFQFDMEAINKSNVFFFDLSTMDEGTHEELGFALAKKYNGEDVKSTFCSSL